ncbi:MAG: transglutaminase domain-containing protein [Candidatus Dojkabacteria bacterium]
MKYPIGLITALIFFTVSAVAAPVAAQKATVESISTEVTFHTDLTAYVSTTLKLKNRSDQYLLSEIAFTLPRSPQNFKARIDDRSVSADIKGKKVNLNLGSGSIELNQKGTLELEYQLKGLVEDFGVIKRMSWPTTSFAPKRGELGKLVQKISYPSEWGELTYKSGQLESEPGIDGFTSFSSTTDETLSLVAGGYTNAELSMGWRITNQLDESIRFRVPVPGESVGMFKLDSYEGAKSGFMDEEQNKFLTLHLDSNVVAEGNFSGVFGKTGFMFNGEGDGLVPDGFQTDWQQLGITKEDAEGIYKKILEKLHPSLINKFKTRSNVAGSLSKDEHDSLDYSNLLVAALRGNGIQSEIVFGLVNFPTDQTYHWHYWVVYREGNQWNQIDPFLEDLSGFDYFTQIDQLRIPWGTVPKDNSTDSLGFNHLGLTKDIKFDPPVVEGAQPDSAKVFALLELTGNAYSGQPLPLLLRVVNGSNVPVSLSDISIENVKVATDEINSFWIIPHTSQLIQVDEISVSDPFFTGEKTVSGSMKVQLDDETRVLDISLPLDIQVNYQMLSVNLLILFLLLILASVFARKRFLNKGF